MLDPIRTPELERPLPPSEQKGDVVLGFSWAIRNSFNGGPSRRPSYQVTLLSWMASFIDGLIVLGINCLFVIMVAKIGHIAIHKFLFIRTFFLSSWIYMFFLRTFFGGSIGERACDLRLGLPSDRKRPQYFLKVLVRSTVVVLSGLVVLPLLSVIIGHDIQGKISGLKLYSLK